MLHKNHISNVQIYTPEWDKIRLGRFTSSKMSTLMGDKPFTQGAISYIHQKAGERLVGQTLAEEEAIIEDENTAWGLQYEPEAINKFGIAKGIKYLVTQKIIFDPAGQTSSTPDALWIIDSSVLQEDCYNVATVEVKCPRKYHRFFPLFACSTPQEIKSKYPGYYWQVIDQMSTCSSVIGYFVCYHPLFKAYKNLKIIEFLKIDLWADFALLEQRKALAIQRFNEIVSEFIR